MGNNGSFNCVILKGLRRRDGKIYNGESWVNVTPEIARIYQNPDSPECIGCGFSCSSSEAKS
jgi:hypothetical protein